MKPMAKMTVAIINAKTDDVFPNRNEIPAAVTSAVPISRCSISVWLKCMLLFRAGISMLWTPLVLPACIGIDMALADLSAFTRQVSVQS
jgi:hypothetical protein